MNALQILKKIRKYELETEEFHLMQRHRAVYQTYQTLEVAEVKLEQDLQKQSEIQSLSFRQHLGSHFVESEQKIQQLTEDHTKALQERDQQIMVTIQSKQRLDMIDRVIQHRHEADIAEEDHRERKFLDDITQIRYALGVTS